MSLTAIVSIALVVVVLSGFLSMGRGFETALANTGSESVGIALSNNADTEIGSNIGQDEANLLKGIVTRVYGDSSPISLETINVVASNQLIPGSKVNLFLRGVVEDFPELHEGFKLVQGRLFTSGTPEIIIGENLYNRSSSVINMGEEIRLGGFDWTVVGVFKLRGDLFESEIWGSAGAIQSYFGRQNQYQSIRVPIRNEGDLFDLSLAIAEEKRLTLHLQTEKNYYEVQSRQLSGLVKYVGWPLALLMSIGAVCGTFICLKTAVDTRRRDLIILKLLGFNGAVPFTMLMYEAMFFAVAGACLGLAISFLLFDGLLASTFDDSFNTVTYALRLDSTIAIKAFLFSLVMGFVSGVVPAYLGAKTNAS